jgi:EAL and modified HD-GYP domain-containing signal transduction protein
MKVFLARQSIYNINKDIIGYELLFRNGKENRFPNIDGDTATIEVIKNSFLNIGFNEVTQNKKAFINFTENILKSDISLLVKPNQVVVEILENIDPKDEVVQTCRLLKEKGYILALDDFIYDEKFIDLINLVDIIKVDFSLTKGIERKKVLEKINSKKIVFLAEKIETYEDYVQAIEYGYIYFQGYYFSKPLVISQKQITGNKLLYIEILNCLNSSEINFNKLEELIKRDLSLSVKILRLINSSYYCFTNKITTIKQALIILGEDQIRRWGHLIIVKSLGKTSLEYLVIDSLIRARFCELLCIKTDCKEGTQSYSAYLVGMLERIDIILETSMDKILEDLFISNEVKEVLLGNYDNQLGKICNLVNYYESAKWDAVENISHELNLDLDYVSYAYYESIRWVSNISD